MTTKDTAVLASAYRNIEDLLGRLKVSMLTEAPLSEQLPLVYAVADQYDLVGMTDAAQSFRQQADDLGRRRAKKPWWRRLW